jgi:tRNA-uridine 2-sulfurtransferase
MKKERIIIGVSGGVDSAVCAHLLKSQGHDVVGVYMQNWEADNEDPFCTASQDLLDAERICEHLSIEFHSINFSKEYWDNVFQYCLDEFHLGRTPNPDIWCNKEIKFKTFLNYANSLSADKIATGHYAKIIKNTTGIFELHKATDVNKDQTYFLYTLGQHELSQAVFPLSNLTKPQVRSIAAEIKLPNATKRDSTGICFIGERRFKQFLQEFILGKPGAIITTDGETIGKHDGLMYYTLGQRKGLNIGGVKNQPESAWYVVDKIMDSNQLIVACGDNHPRLMSSALICNNSFWVKSPPQAPLHCFAKTRYRQTDQACEIIPGKNSDYLVKFNCMQRAVTPGQSVVFYHGTECLGGATIKERLA